MLHWKPEYLHAFVSERSPQKLFDIAVHLAQDLDMDYLGLNIRIQIATQTPRLYLYSNYPIEWIERYQRDDFYKLVLQVAGQGVVEQQQRRVVLDPGHWILYDPRIPYSITNPKRCSLLVTQVPRSASSGIWA